MSAHVVFLGPSTAGKTSLMLGLAGREGDQTFSVDRTWTTRQRRPNEGDDENVFATPAEFEQKRADFLFTFQTFPTYEYGIARPSRLREREIRMRILMPTFAIKFRQLIDAPTILCSVSPFSTDPERIIKARDPGVNPDDMHARLQRFHQDQVEADEVADFCFQNEPGLVASVTRLGNLITSSLLEVA